MLSNILAAGAATSLLTACYATSSVGETRVRGADPIVTIGAGYLNFGGINVNKVPAYYLIDRQAKLCYFSFVVQSPTIVNCCALVAHEAARRYLPWCPAVASTAPASIPECPVPSKGIHEVPLSSGTGGAQDCATGCDSGVGDTAAPRAQ
jgi:hypothetical protein